jgi:HK97 family phage prohead protease
MLNHTKDIGGQKDGNLELYEDAIGLHARATITDPEVIDKAKEGRLVGWSFGFYDREVEQKRDENGYPLRDVIDLDLEEVSILDDRTTPAYDGTLVSVRSDDKSIYYGESFTDEIQLREERTEDVPKQQETVEKDKHYEEYKQLLEEMKEE